MSISTSSRISRLPQIIASACRGVLISRENKTRENNPKPVGLGAPSRRRVRGSSAELFRGTTPRAWDLLSRQNVQEQIVACYPHDRGRVQFQAGPKAQRSPGNRADVFQDLEY
jgi:hypothetical protein